jgi:mannose-1-phosphate guanylyltransferase
MKQKDVYAVLLVGGSGTRFWPQSRQKMPKQFLSMMGNDSLFQKTLQRIVPLVSPDHVYIVANRQYKKIIFDQMAAFKVPRSQVLFEPEAKNTAPAVGWVSAVIHKRDPEATLVVLPSDHLILKQKKYSQVLKKAIRLARQDCLVTLGIVPTRPETGYGYLRTKEVTVKGRKQIKVLDFVEKPDLARAKRYIKKKNYFWNSGMFVWRTDVILKEFQQYLPRIYRYLHDGPSQKQIGSRWKKIQGISVDYGILEHSRKVMAVKAQGIGWSDLGSWESMADLWKKDKNANILKGDVKQIDCSDSLIWGQDRFIATIGLKDVIIIDTPDALLVCNKDNSQDVKKITRFLKQQKKPQL